MTDWPMRVVLVGAGKMGGALARGWLRGGLPGGSLSIVEPNPSEELLSFAASERVRLNEPNSTAPEVLVLAIKPQSLETAAPGLAPLIARRTLIISILAGKSISTLKQSFSAAEALVRAMPNTPAAIGRGATAAFANSAVGERQRGWTERLLAAVGSFHWVASEDAIDAVTAISGSGPAYVFAMTEALAAAAEKLGLPPDLSMALARATVEGAGELMRRQAGTSPSVLRQDVTSPGGTTAAALAILRREGGLFDLMAQATAAARARAREMAE